MATLRELSTDYSLEEAHLLYEVLLVRQANEWLSYQRAEQQNR